MESEKIYVGLIRIIKKRLLKNFKLQTLVAVGLLILLCAMPLNTMSSEINTSYQEKNEAETFPYDNGQSESPIFENFKEFNKMSVFGRSGSTEEHKSFNYQELFHPNYATQPSFLTSANYNTQYQTKENNKKINIYGKFYENRLLSKFIPLGEHYWYQGMNILSEGNTYTDPVGDVIDIMSGEYVTEHQDIDVDNIDATLLTYNIDNTDITISLEVNGNIENRGNFSKWNESGYSFDDVVYIFYLATVEEYYEIYYVNNVCVLINSSEEFEFISSFEVDQNNLTIGFQLNTRIESFSSIFAMTWYIKGDLEVWLVDFAPDIEYLMVEATAPNSGEVGETIDFQATVWNGQEPYTFSWEFGDGGTSTEESPSHIYQEEGFYQYTLTVTDNQSSTASDFGYITIYAPEPETSTVCGYVNDSEGRGSPIEGVQVNVWDHDSDWGNGTQTDAEGYYEMNTISGNLGLDVHMDGYFDEWIDWFYIEEGETKQFDFTLEQIPPETSTVYGYVNDSEGNPIEGVQVNVWSHDTGWVNDTQTDINGDYVMHTISGNLGLNVYIDGYFEEWIDWFYIEEGETKQFNFTLEQKDPDTSIVCGNVTDSGGKPIEGVWVSLHDQYLDRFANGTETNSDGYYEIGIYSGQFYIDTHKDGDFDYHDNIQIGDDETLWFDIELEDRWADTSKICGFVNNTEGELIVGGDVWLHDTIRNTWANGTETNDVGYYEMEIYEGDFNLGARKEGHFDYNKNINVPDNHVMWMNITLEKIPPENSVIKGYIKDENGDPLQPDELIIIDFIRMYSNSTSVDSNGYYEINVWYGKLFVSTVIDGFDSNTTRVNIGENEIKWNNITLYPENAWVHGYITDDEGNPFENVNIILYNTYSSLNFGDNVAFTDDNGYYNISLHEGYYIGFIAKAGGGWPFGMDEYDSLIFEVNIALNQDVNISQQLERAPETPTAEVFADFSDWDHINTFLSVVMVSMNQSKILRLYIEYLIGDGDYFLTESEYDEFFELWTSGQGGSMAGINTENALTVDDIYYNFENGVGGFENFIGWWNQTTSIAMFNDVNYTSNETVPYAPSHIFKMNVSYKNYERYQIVHISFPIEYGMISYNATNVTVTGVTNITILPGGDPNPDDEITAEWIEMAIVEVLIQPLESGEHTVDARDLADTIVNVNITGDTNITIGKYPFNPHPEDPPPDALNKYIEIDIEDESVVEWPINITIYYTQHDLDASGVEEGELLGIYFWNDTANEWQLYTVTGVNTTDHGYAGYCWVEAWHLTPLGMGGNRPPTVVSISSPTNGATVSGSITITGTASDQDGEIENVQINIDGSWIDVTGTASWTHSWDTTSVSDGSHTISARAFDSDKYSSVVSISVNVDNVPEEGGDPGGDPGGDDENEAPDADASASETFGFVNTPITFDGSRSSDDFGIANYTWDFGDGTTGEGKTTTHTYTESGTYSVKLTVTDNESLTDDDIIQVVISQANHPPTNLIVTGPTSGSVNLDMGYSAIATDEDENDTIRYTFDWGDDTNNTISSPLPSNTTFNASHNWTVSGVYIIKVNAKDKINATSNTISKMVLIDVDVKFIDGVIEGYLIDYNQNGTYDVFYNNATNEETSVLLQDDGTYLINSDGVGEWDYTYNPITGTLTEYKQAEEKEEEKDEEEGILVEIILIIIAALTTIAVIIYLYKKK